MALTGQPVFATAAATVDQHVPTEEPSGGVVEPGGTVRDGNRASATITTPNQVDSYDLDLGESTVLRLADVTGEVGASGRDTLRVRPIGPDGYDEPGFTYITRYQWKVKRAGTYKLRVWRDDGDTGPYSFTAIAAKERRSTMTVGQRISGRLDVRGRVDLYTFTAPRSGKIFIKDCTGDTHLNVGVVEDSPSPDVLRAREVCTDLDLMGLTAGEQYVLVIWSENEQTGSYSLSTEINAARLAGQR